MQAKKDYEETKSSDRDYIDDETQFVKEGDANYDTLDPEKWMTVTRTPTGFLSSLRSTKRFKAKIARRAYEMTPDELAANPYNPNGIKALSDFQSQLDAAPGKKRKETAAQYNGRKNRDAWAKFQKFGKNTLTETKYEGEDKYWDMNEIDPEILYPKLKIMSRMVYDYPELQGNIGSLERMNEEHYNKDVEEAPKSTSPTKKKNIQYRPRMKQKKTSDEPEPERPKGQTYMSTRVKTLYPDEDALFRASPDYKSKENYARHSAFPLRMNATIDAIGEGKREFRAEKSKNNVDTHNLAADIQYLGNHEMGHMLNYLLVKEMYRKKGFEKSFAEGFEERSSAISHDVRFDITAAEMVEKALQQTMPPEEFAKLKRYKEDSLDKGEAWDPSIQLDEDEEWVTKDTDPRHKAGQIDLKGSGLGGDENNIGYTSAYGATNASEFIAEAFADVYKNGSQARPTSIKLVQIYEKNMKFFKKINAGEKVAISDESMPDMLQSAIDKSYKFPKKKKSE